MQRALKCDFGDTNSEIKQKFILATNSNKLRRYCFRNPDITLENLLTYAKTLEDAESQAEEIEKMSKNVEEVNFTKKSKKQDKADEGAKETGKGGYFGRKSCQDSTQKTCFRCGGGYPHTSQCPAIGKTCNHCHKKIISKKFRSNTGHGESLNHLTASLTSLGLNLILIMKYLQYKLYFLTFLIIKRYLLRKTRQKSHLSSKPTVINLLLSKRTLTNLFLGAILQH